jgi:hypothetical protein
VKTLEATGTGDKASEIEIVADTVRLARAAPPGRTAREILDILAGYHPLSSDLEIRTAMGKAAILLDHQHGG